MTVRREKRAVIVRGTRFKCSVYPGRLSVDCHKIRDKVDNNNGKLPCAMPQIEFWVRVGCVVDLPGISYC